MSGKPIWDGFHEAWEDFKTRDHHFPLITNYMNSSEGREALKLDQVRNILSIGPGTGELEENMMTLCPNLKEMTLLDPDCHQYQALVKRFKIERGVKVKCQNMMFENYEGPKEGFDMVFCCECFYHFTDIELQFERALSLVKKEGKLVVIIDPHNSIFSVIAENISINEEHNVYDILKALFIKQKLYYKEKELHNEYDFSDLGRNGSYDLIDVMSNKPVSYEEKVRVMKEWERMKAFVPGTKTIKFTMSVLIVNKE